KNLIYVIKTLTEYTDPLYVYDDIGSYKDLQPSKEEILDIKMNLSIINVFSQKLVRKIGEKKLLSAPAWKVEELENDSILIVTQDNPVTPSDEWKDAHREVEEHLGIR
ncbi:MAG: hypothetical protein SXQ77_03420, partial [Halobacteria archaeon]|nr:hypothetical protein [Halobacteria archaeon]